jgi:flagellar hook-length control protein FliK
MPRSHATSLTAAAPELIGPAVPIASSDSGQAAFGSLLQTTKLAAVGTPQQPANGDKFVAATHEIAKSRPIAPILESDPPSKSRLEPGEDSHGRKEQSTEPLVAESLAALVLIAPTSVAANWPPSTETMDELEVAPSAQPFAANEASGPVTRLPALRPIFTPPKRALPQRHDRAAAVAETIVERHIVEQTQPVMAALQPTGIEGFAIVEEVERPAGEHARPKRTSGDPVSDSEVDEPSNDESKSGLDVAATTRPDNQSVPADSPLAAAAPTPTQQSTDYSAAQIVVSPNAAAELRVQHSRLPAQRPAMAAVSEPRSIVARDTGRLLTRVVRAFAAAQQRDGQILMRLSPPELGSLLLEIRVDDGGLSARLHTDTEAARAAILDNLTALRDRLADQGLRIERFDVDLMQRQPGGMPDQPGGRQHDAPAVPPSIVPATQERRPAPTAPRPQPGAAGSVSGLNVIV